MKRIAKHIVPVILAVCLLVSAVGICAAAPAEKTASAPVLAAEAVTAQQPETVAISAKTSDPVKSIADGFVASKRSASGRVQGVIDSILAPLAHIKPTNNKDELKMMLTKSFVDGTGNVLNGAIEGLLKIFPERDFVKYEDYKTENYLAGTSDYKTEPAAGAVWNVGYSRVSIIPDDVFEHDYYTAGYFNNYTGQMKVTEVLDDQCMTVICVNDGTGSGTAVFIALDGFAISNANVRKLRERLKDFIAENNIVSLNITASHSHYCIDTSGLGAALLPFVGDNLLNSFRLNKQMLSSTDEKFMEVVFSRGAQAVKDAVNSMKPGKLYYRATNIADMINDKQTPIVFDENINTLRFVPNDSSDEIWLVNAGIHPTGYNRNSTAVSAEFPYAVVKYSQELAGAKAAFYQGAQAEISKNTSSVYKEGSSDFDTIQRYGKRLVGRIMSPDSETEIKPYLNVTHAEIFMKIENPVLMAAAKLQLINNTCVSTTGRLKDSLLVTEIGYCEFGDTLSLFLSPGEISPEIAFGGAKTAAESWNGTDWDYDSLEKTSGKKMIVFGLTNDEIGYILPDNEVATAFADMLGDLLGDDAYGERNPHYAEMLAISSDAASSIVRYYEAMLEDYRGF